MTMFDYRAKISGNGRVVIPADCRQALELQKGDEVIFRVTGNVITLLSVKQALKEAQQLVKKHNKKKLRLSEELIKMRREEGKHE
jgi:AbrB family looped-hinge helix DNA binding protein